MEPLRNLLTQKKDYYAGGLMTLIGVGSILEARHYNLGTLFHMGPGFFPIILGVIMTFLGILITAVAATAEAGSEETQSILPKPAMVGLVLHPGGAGAVHLFREISAAWRPATFACVFVSALGDRTATWKSSFILRPA